MPPASCPRCFRELNYSGYCESCCTKLEHAVTGYVPISRQLLRELAEAAPDTTRDACSHGTMPDGSKNPDWLVSGMGSLLTHITEAEAKFVAATDRRTILALLDEIDHLEERAKRPKITNDDRVVIRELIEMLRKTAMHPPERRIRDLAIVAIEKLVS